MRKLLFCAMTIVVAASALAAAAPAGQAMKPVLVASFCGYEHLRKDLQWLGKLADNPDLASVAEAELQQQLGVKDFGGLDKARPWGVVVQTDGQEFTGFVFLPVTSFKEFLKTFEEKWGEPRPASDGVQELQIEGRPVFVKQAGAWALASNAPETLAAAPEDPLPLLDKLNESYDLALRVTVKNIPPMLRQMFLGMLQMGMQPGLARQEGESEEQYALRAKMAQEAMQQMVTMVNELDTVLVGVTLDQEASVGRLEYVITALEGTKTARQMAQTKSQKTEFAGLLQPDAAATLLTAGELAESDVAQAKIALEGRKLEALRELDKQALGEEELKLAKQLITDLADVVQQTLESRQLDAGMLLFLEAERLTLVAGTRVADGAKLEDLVKQVARQAAKDQPELQKAIHLDEQRHEGYRFHRFSLPAEQLAQVPNLSRFVGSSLEVIIAVGEKSAYVAAGRDASKTLKNVIDQSKAQAGKLIPPMELTVQATPIARFAAAAAEGETAGQQLRKVVDLLEKPGGNDRITMTTTSVPNGAQVRVEVQQGILKLIGTLPRMMGDQ